MFVKIVKHCCVPYEGYNYTPADGVFELPDNIANALIDTGTCAEVDSAIADDDEYPLLRLPSVTDALYTVLAEANYTTLQDILDADVDDLVALHGIGEKTAETLKTEAFELVSEE